MKTNTFLLIILICIICYIASFSIILTVVTNSTSVTQDNKITTNTVFGVLTIVCAIFAFIVVGMIIRKRKIRQHN